MNYTGWPEGMFLSMNNYTMEYTPKFLDVHSIVNYSENELKNFHDLPRDEYGVKTLNIFYKSGWNIILSCGCSRHGSSRKTS